MPEPEGPALSTGALSPSWGYRLASQVVIGEVLGVTRTLFLCTGQSRPVFTVASVCLLAKFICPAFPPCIYKSSQCTGICSQLIVENCTVGKPPLWDSRKPREAFSETAVINC